MTITAHSFQQSATERLVKDEMARSTLRQENPKPLSKARRAGFYVAGLVCLGLAIAGAALPLLPTTPFLLLAAFCFARSSPRLHAWLINHQQFGPLIENWRRHGAISRTAKRSALLVIALTPVLSIVLGVPLWALACQSAVLVCSAVFIVTRPDGPSEDKTVDN